MSNLNRLNKLIKEVKTLYSRKKEELPFHGWHHIYFVFKKSREFSASLGANQFIVQSAALVHDINYLFGSNPDPKIGGDFRKSILEKCGFSKREIDKIETVIIEAHTAFRNDSISVEAKALSDADSLFKVLPITPVLFANKYMTENNITIDMLAKKIITDQNRLMDAGIFFYSSTAVEKYQEWALVNLKLWNCIIDSLDDSLVIEILSGEIDINTKL